MYAYGANNPVHYIDPIGMFNFETNTIEEGDTLSKIADEYNSKNGNKIYSGNSLDFSSFMKTNDSNSSGTDKHGYSRASNITIGVLEITTGLVIASGSIVTATGIDAVSGGIATIPAGYAVLSGWATGSTLVAFGITRIANSNNEKVSDDIRNAFMPSVVGISQEIDKVSRRKP